MSSLENKFSALLRAQMIPPNEFGGKELRLDLNFKKLQTESACDWSDDVIVTSTDLQNFFTITRNSFTIDLENPAGFHVASSVLESNQRSSLNCHLMLKKDQIVNILL